MIAVYPGTFDPITIGHLDLIERVSKLFSVVYVAVAENVQKRTLFSLEDRLFFTQQACKHWNNIQVLPCTGLMKDFVLEHQINVMIRGIRSSTDFEYEFQLAGMNHALMPQVETIFFSTQPSLQFISSSFIRELLRFKPQEALPFLPSPIQQTILSTYLAQK